VPVSLKHGGPALTRAGPPLSVGTHTVYGIRSIAWLPIASQISMRTHPLLVAPRLPEEDAKQFAGVEHLREEAHRLCLRLRLRFGG
ncbi:hypothetical protein AB0J72_54160, partial [Dactylosporangium sp. NPDC049742]|uniref:hypothetical protein n=1 Tax=Dactylosporangium sp. NPDC049742 TaxID=3154737 RepID=UPI0034483E97